MTKTKSNGTEAFEILCALVGLATPDDNQRMRWQTSLRRMQKMFDGDINEHTDAALYFFTMVVAHLALTHRDDEHFTGDEAVSQATMRHGYLIYKGREHCMLAFPMKSDNSILDKVAVLSLEDIDRCRRMAEEYYAGPKVVDPEADDTTEVGADLLWDRIIALLKR